MTKEEEARKREDHATLKELLEKYYPQVSYDSESDFLEDIGYEQCVACENFFMGQSLQECNACSELFCNDCQPEHGNEETGF